MPAYTPPALRRPPFFTIGMYFAALAIVVAIIATVDILYVLATG